MTGKEIVDLFGKLTTQMREYADWCAKDFPGSVAEHESTQKAEACESAYAALLGKFPDPETGLIPPKVRVEEYDMGDGSPSESRPSYCVVEKYGNIIDGFYSSADECKRLWNIKQG